MSGLTLEIDMMFGQSKTELGLDARRIFLSILGGVLLLVIASLVAKLPATKRSSMPSF